MSHSARVQYRPSCRAPKDESVTRQTGEKGPLIRTQQEQVANRGQGAHLQFREPSGGAVAMPSRRGASALLVRGDEGEGRKVWRFSLGTPVGSGSSKGGRGALPAPVLPGELPEAVPPREMQHS